MDLGISGRRVTITGASQGIGEAIAIAFADEGCKISVIARREEKLKELVERLGGESAGHAYSAVDLMEDGGPTRAVEELSEKSAKPTSSSTMWAAPCRSKIPCLLWKTGFG